MSPFLEATPAPPHPLFANGRTRTRTVPFRHAIRPLRSRHLSQQDCGCSLRRRNHTDGTPFGPQNLSLHVQLILCPPEPGRTDCSTVSTFQPCTIFLDLLSRILLSVRDCPGCVKEAWKECRSLDARDELKRGMIEPWGGRTPAPAPPPPLSPNGGPPVISESPDPPPCIHSQVSLPAFDAHIIVVVPSGALSLAACGLNRCLGLCVVAYIPRTAAPLALSCASWLAHVVGGGPRWG